MTLQVYLKVWEVSVGKETLKIHHTQFFNYVVTTSLPEYNLSHLRRWDILNITNGTPNPENTQTLILDNPFLGHNQEYRRK